MLNRERGLTRKGAYSQNHVTRIYDWFLVLLSQILRNHNNNNNDNCNNDNNDTV